MTPDLLPIAVFWVDAGRGGVRGNPLYEQLRCAESDAVAAEVLAGGVPGTGDEGFLRAEVPAALEQTLEGVERVAAIVRAMSEFAHPGEGLLAVAHRSVGRLGGSIGVASVVGEGTSVCVELPLPVPR